MIGQVLLAAAVMLGLAGLFAALLGVASRRLAVRADPLALDVLALLPGANCGNCGFASCAAYAAAIARGEAGPERCTVGGPAVHRAVAARIGVDARPSYPWRPVVHCGATAAQRLRRGRYDGERSCAAAEAVGGVQGCSYGCLGFGDCVAACHYDAMRMEDGLPRIDYDKCVGCGACVRACPRDIIEQIPFKADRMLVVACRSHDPGRSVREVCEVGCLGCARCARIRPDLFRIEDGLAEIDYERYTGEEDLGEVRESCPMKSLVVFGAPPGGGGPGEEEAPALRGPSVPDRPSAEDLAWRG